MKAQGQALGLCCLLLFLATHGHGKTVHVVFSNHLDIGFDNIEPLVAYDYNVYLKYWHEYFPRAVNISEAMWEASPNQDRYTYLTHSYMVSLFMDCPLHLNLPCPGQQLKERIVQAITKGIITWHAHPHNAQHEFYDASLLEFSVKFTHDLDRRFAQPLKRTLILRDVPGLSRAVIPILTAQGVRGISVGVNPGSAPPGVPQFTPFIWRDEETGSQLVAFWRPGGYGGIHGGVNLDPPDQCIQVQGLDHVLCTAWRNDNAGPPESVEEPLRIYELLYEEWGPAANITASTFDAFVDAVYESLPSLDLPVVTGEIGDTWIYGVGSDPLKTADFRAASRARANCLAQPACPSDTPEFYEFSRMLLKVPEHTWGLDVKKELADFVNYTNKGFHKCLAEPRCPNYQKLITSWERQAGYVDWGLQALPHGHPVVEAVIADTLARGDLAATNEDMLLTIGAIRMSPAEVAAHGPFRSQHWELEVDPATGGLSKLVCLYEAPQAAHAAAAQSGTCVLRSLLGSIARAILRLQRPLLDAGKLLLDLLEPSNPLSLSPEPAASSLRNISSTQGASHGQESSELKHRSRHDQGAKTGVDWAAGSTSVLGQLHYHVYQESSYDVIWDSYAVVLVQDFGKYNSSASWNKTVQAVGELEWVYELRDRVSEELQQLYLCYSFPLDLVTEAGAPPLMWQVLSFPKDVPAIDIAVVWQNKTATRLPEALWYSFIPGVAADPESWTMRKINSSIHPHEVLLNGSQSLHVVSNISIRSTACSSQPPTSRKLQGRGAGGPWPAQQPPGAAGRQQSSSTRGHTIEGGCEVLTITPLDAPLVSPGAPNPFPNGQMAPDLSLGMHFNLENNIWGTNYVMWVPWSDRDVNMAFRFRLMVAES